MIAQREIAMSTQRPDIGEWYRLRDGDSFEVVAVDEADGTIEVQYFDGTVEEIELSEWRVQSSNGEIEDAEAPEDWSGSVDVESNDEPLRMAGEIDFDGERRSAAGFDGLDLFE
jgi:hypothetical protein